MPSDALKQMSINNAPPQRDMGAVSRINQYKSLVSSGVNAQDARRQVRTGNFNPTIPPVIPSTDLAGNKTFEDVMDTRANLESEANAKQQLNTDYANLTTRIGNTTLPSPFTNPEETINRLLLRGTTDTQRQLDEKGQTQADTIRGFASDYTKAGTEARTQFGIPELQTGLAETRNRIAERQVKLRETLRDFETNAERRGVAREFVDSEKAKVQADAATELADLSIIENAQLGNLNEARAEVDDILAEKRQAFEFENSAIEAEIARLDKMDTREAEVRSEQLQIALQERTRNIETALANEKEQRGYLVDAAANGADQGTLMAIRNAKTPQEAAFLASPFIGRLDRMQAEANMAQSWASVANSNTARLLSLAEAGDPDAIAKLKFDPRTIKEEVDPVSRRQLEASVDSGSNLIRLASKYKKIIDDYGYTNTAFGDTGVLGEIDSLRALMTAEYKKAEALGTLDTGVLTLMSQIIGEEPTSGFFTPLTNATGRRSDKLSSQLNTFIENMTLGQAKDKARLGIEPDVDFSLILPEDDEEINTAFGITTSTQSEGGFNPQTYFKK